MNFEQKLRACELVALEAQLLDEQKWDDWLALYEEDCVFWMPMWRDEGELTQDPLSELSFIYMQGHKLLAERVFRITSGRSSASNPVPRTAHLVAGSVATQRSDGSVIVRSAWSSHIYQHKDAHLNLYAGRYEHRLVWRGDDLRIQSKKVIVINDKLQSKVDFFYI